MVFIQKAFYRAKAMEKIPFASMENISELKREYWCILTISGRHSRAIVVTYNCISQCTLFQWNLLSMLH